MRYRVIVGWHQVHKFKNYSEALSFAQETGGILYEQVMY